MSHQTTTDQSGHVKTTIDISGWFDLPGVISFVKTLYTLPGSHEYLLDFKNTKFMTPFGMLYLASHFRHISKSSTAKFFVTNHENHGYLSHMGFFQSFGLDHGNKPGQARGSDTYVPVTTTNLAAFKQGYLGNQIGQHCEDVGQKLAAVLLKENKSLTYTLLSYTIREMLRNVLEHSDAFEMSYCAQFWQKSGRAEIAVLDDGKGIWNGLATNPYLKIKSNNEALNLSLLPGISGKTFKGVKNQPGNEWQNSGLGLYVTSRLCSDYGAFFIASGDAGVHIAQGNKKQFQPDLKGTVVMLAIDTRKITNSSRDIIQKIVKEGKEREVYLKNCGDIEGDKASMMVSEDMKKTLLK